VQLVDDVVFQLEAQPAPVAPGEIAGDDFGRPVHAFGLEAGGGIGPLFIVQPVKIAAAWPDALDDRPVVSPRRRLQGRHAVLGRHEVQVDAPGERRPHFEAGFAAAEISRAEGGAGFAGSSHKID